MSNPPLQWRKLGVIHDLPPARKGDAAWMRSHTQIPTPVALDAQRIRVYYGTRDERNRTHTVSFDVDAADPARTFSQRNTPILPLGPAGAFDDAGVMPSWAMWHDDRLHLYYIGWNVSGDARFTLGIGLAISDDGGDTFTRAADTPLLGPGLGDPFGATTPCVHLDGERWRMWYASFKPWIEHKGRSEPVYAIRYAESDNGIAWRPREGMCVDFADEREGGLVRPSVIERDGHFAMWYSRRAKVNYREDAASAYRAGYAESDDGVTWRRRDERAGIDVSDDGFDTQMIAYPAVIEAGERLLMFYNGNGFGQTGVGLAVAPPNLWSPAQGNVH